MPSSHFRIGLVGCGRISAKHIAAIALDPNRASLVALCDVSPEKIELAASQYISEGLSHQQRFSSPKQYTSFNQLLYDVRHHILVLDLLVLATPSGLHPEQAMAAAELGLHVCTEKPMATRWMDGVQMVKAFDQAGTKLFVVKQNRFNSTLQLLKRQLERNRFGQIAIVNINVFWQRPQQYYDQASWRGTWEFDGGALMNQASHYVDLLDWLIGPVESLSASIATIARSIEVEDSAVLQLKWRNGALGTMAVTMLTYPENLEGSITIIGERGTVKVGGTAVNKIEHWSFADESSDDDLIHEASYATSNVYGFGHAAYYKSVFDSLSGIDVEVCDGREGLKSLEILIGAYRSARDLKVIHLPLVY